jgi:hypothetical protein
MRVVGVDIGMKNMAVCSLDIQPVCATNLETVREYMRDDIFRHWEVFDVTTSTGTITKQMDVVIDWCNSNSFLFEDATHVVIEQQMTARMKNISTCLYVCIRNINKDAKIILQPATKKLLWSDIASFVTDCDLKSYYQRKKTAICVARELLCDCENASSILLSEKKKDDLADSFLHALFYAFSGKSQRSFSARTKRR